MKLANQSSRKPLNCSRRFVDGFAAFSNAMAKQRELNTMNLGEETTLFEEKEESNSQQNVKKISKKLEDDSVPKNTKIEMTWE